MLIYIKSSEMKRPIRIPMPYHMAINLFVRKSFAKMIAKGIAEDAQKENEGKKTQAEAIRLGQEWIEALDFAELRDSLHELRSYKGMALVDIHSEDGQVVKIII